jgi:hypothetical protein
VINGILCLLEVQQVNQILIRAEQGAVMPDDQMDYEEMEQWNNQSVLFET